MLGGPITEQDFSALTVASQQLVDYQQQPPHSSGVVAGQGDQGEAAQEVRVDPELNFSQSEESDFEDVFQVREDPPRPQTAEVEPDEQPEAQQVG